MTLPIGIVIPSSMKGIMGTTTSSIALLVNHSFCSQCSMVTLADMPYLALKAS